MPGLLSSTVCLTVTWLLSLSLCPSQAQIWTNEVSGVQYGQLGSNVTLACGMSQPGTPVEWRLNRSSVLPWHRVTSDGTLVLVHVDQTAQGNYSCHDNHGHLLHTIRLRLGYPPGQLTVSCRVPNHNLVRCSWVDSVETFLPSQYHASYRGTSQSTVRPCVVDAALRRCNITQPTFWQTAHWLNITETNPLGSMSTVTTIRLHHLLKPDPPESVVVEGKEGSPTRLVVSWSYPSTWPNNWAYIFPLVFQIRYKPQGSTHWSQMESKESPVEILDALAGHPHQVQVRAQDEVDSYSQWSDWSPLLLAWPWRGYSTMEPTSEPFLDDLFPDTDEPETSTAKSHNSTVEDGSLGLVILLALFSVVIFTTVFSLVLVLWMRQRRLDHVNRQELTSMVKMKSMPI